MKLIAAASSVVILGAFLLVVFAWWVFTPYYTGLAGDSKVIPFLAAAEPKAASGARLGLYESEAFEACVQRSGTAEFLTAVSSSPVVGASASSGSSQCSEIRVVPVSELGDLCPALDLREISSLLNRGPYTSSCPEGFRRLLDGFDGLYCLACTEGSVHLVRSGSGNRWGTETIVTYDVDDSGEVRLVKAASREFAHERFPEF